MKKSFKVIKKTTKIYNVSKGQDDFKVWTKGTDFLCDYMTTKRKGKFSVVKTRKHIQVRITISELRKIEEVRRWTYYQMNLLK